MAQHGGQADVGYGMQALAPEEVGELHLPAGYKLDGARSDRRTGSVPCYAFTGRQVRRAEEHEEHNGDAAFGEKHCLHILGRPAIFCKGCAKLEI